MPIYNGYCDYPMNVFIYLHAQVPNSCVEVLYFKCDEAFVLGVPTEIIHTVPGGRVTTRRFRSYQVMSTHQDAILGRIRTGLTMCDVS